MFAHPQCACTRASLTELERIMMRAGDRIAAHVLPDNISTEEKRRLGRVKTSVVELKTQPGNYDENPNNEVRILG
jgi:hypothetical protein